jgi:hypothetical protein
MALIMFDLSTSCEVCNAIIHFYRNISLRPVNSKFNQNQFIERKGIKKYDVFKF